MNTLLPRRRLLALAAAAPLSACRTTTAAAPSTLAGLWTLVAADRRLPDGSVTRKYGVGSVLKGSVNAAVDSAGKHLAKELAPRRVNVISHGVTDTSQWGEPGSPKRLETLERVSAALPVKRVATPEELASAYLFVMTNPFVTGAVVDVDGGGLL
jgi:NAD(P)-dependent dehydrogenase (short-subunit alcohol dehydrogenase family)